MKSEVTDYITNLNGYPYLGVSPKADGIVVLFTKQETGTVVFSNSSKHYDIGYFSDNWFESEFEIFRGEVRISN